MKINRTVLFVEDDAVALTTYRNLLQREGVLVKSAQDGLEALKALSQSTPDLVVLNLMLPKFDGADVVRFIRADPRLKVMPIILFSNVRIADLAGDPKTRQLQKSDCTPALLLKTIQEMLSTDPAGASNGDNGIESDEESVVENPPTQEREKFLKDAPEHIAMVHDQCLSYIKSPASTTKLEPLLQNIHSLSVDADKAGCTRIAQLTTAFDMLLSKIAAKPSRVTPSILQTLAEAADCLDLLLKSGAAESTESAPKSKVLALDDDAVCNHVIVNTLKRAHLDVTSLDDPLEGLRQLQADRYDLVLLDIDMPMLNGFEVCEKLRTLPHYKTTPVIFVTAHSNLGNRTQSVLSGGNFFITKPVDPLELALKVTIHLLKSQIKPSNPLPPEIKSRTSNTPEIETKAPVPAPVQQHVNGNGTLKGKARNGIPSEVTLPVTQPQPARPPEEVDPTINDSPVEADVFKNGTANHRVPPSALPVPNGAILMEKPRTANITPASPFPKPARNPVETGTLNGNTLPGGRNQNGIVSNDRDEAFEKIVLAVVRIMYGDNHVTEINIRMVRIALQQYGVHEIVNPPAPADTSGV